MYKVPGKFKKTERISGEEDRIKPREDPEVSGCGAKIRSQRAEVEVFK